MEEGLQYLNQGVLLKVEATLPIIEQDTSVELSLTRQAQQITSLAASNLT